MSYSTPLVQPINGVPQLVSSGADHVAAYDLKTGKPVQMVAGFDEFSTRAYPMYPGGTSRQRWHRELLRRTMESEDFSIYEFEWWHFDYKDWRNYRIGNQTLGEILK